MDLNSSKYVYFGPFGAIWESCCPVLVGDDVVATYLILSDLDDFWTFLMSFGPNLHDLEVFGIHMSLY